MDRPEIAAAGGMTLQAKVLEMRLPPVPLSGHCASAAPCDASVVCTRTIAKKSVS